MTKKSGIPDDNVLCFPWSRAIWDPNREYKNEEEDLELDQWKKYIRDHDFNEQVIIKKPWQFRDTWKSKTELYHSVISSKLELAELLRGWSIWIDIHDTWVNLMNVDPELDTIKEEWFPDMIIWTKDWESCNPEILDFFVERLNHYLWLKIYTNKLYKWWYVTTRHWKEYREELNDWDWLKKSKRNLIQVELGRYLYMKESTQEVDWERMEIIWEWIKRAITDLWLEFWKEYFEKLNR
jgi:N-formylglutamate amidohydrolase